MRAAVLRDGRMVYRDDVAGPVPGPGQVLVGVRACGICGSDLHFAAHGGEMLAMSERLGLGASGMDVDLNRDVFMGHEFSAEILEAGPDTETHPPGTLVTSLPVLLSTTGFDQMVYSNTTIGGYAERILLFGSSPAAHPERSRPQARRTDRAHVGGVARRQQIEHSSGARPPWCSVAAPSASPSSPP